MQKLYLTTVFHCNLNYSSIPVAKRKEVIDTCYWPFLRMAEKLGIRLGFEFSGTTLEIIKELDNALLEKIKQLWKDNKIEVIGSGYVQSIFPLIPADVNLRNLELGNEVYKKLLGKQPSIAFVNEQTYSAGLVELYKKAGYEAIIIDWANAIKYNDWPSDEQYSSGFVRGSREGNKVDESKIRVIWNNCVAFQKLQRYAYGQISLQEYLDYVLNNYSSKKNRCFLLYGNDIEIYNFRVRNPKNLSIAGGIKHDEIKRIEEALQALKNDERIEFIKPGDCLQKAASKNVFKVENAQYPIISKKQDKYNVTRWAVCGRENYKSNSLCYEAYYLLRELEAKNQTKESRQIMSEWWKSLIVSWASDYRTFTDDDKWNDFRKKLTELIESLKQEAKKNNISTDTQDLFAETILNNKKNNKSDNKKEESNKLIRIDEEKYVIETEKILLEIMGSKGGTIRKLVFKNVSDKPFVQHLPHGYFEDVSYSADFFSGHTIAFSGRDKLTDLGTAEMKVEEKTDGVKITAKNKMNDDIIVTKEYFVPYNHARVDVSLELDFIKAITPLTFRCFNINLNPEAFDRQSLYYRTINGGFDKETFPINSDFIKQGIPVELNITARHCLGATDGWLSLGDKDKELVITTNKALCYTAPLIDYETVRGKYFFRVQHSLCETDETTRTELKGKVKLFFSMAAAANAAKKDRTKNKNAKTKKKSKN